MNENPTVRFHYRLLFDFKLARPDFTIHAFRLSDTDCIEKGQSILRGPLLINRLSICFKSGPFLEANRYILPHYDKKTTAFCLAPSRS
jgi:hypothetical protein